MLTTKMTAEIPCSQTALKVPVRRAVRQSPMPPMTRKTIKSGSNTTSLTKNPTPIALRKATNGAKPKQQSVAKIDPTTDPAAPNLSSECTQFGHRALLHGVASDSAPVTPCVSGNYLESYTAAFLAEAIL